MTTVTTLVALLPVMFADGRGADVARAMALPCLGNACRTTDFFYRAHNLLRSLDKIWRWDSQIRYGLNLMKDPPKWRMSQHELERIQISGRANCKHIMLLRYRFGVLHLPVFTCPNAS